MKHSVNPGKYMVLNYGDWMKLGRKLTEYMDDSVRKY
jgi:hypothetical protein